MCVNYIKVPIYQLANISSLHGLILIVAIIMPVLKLCGAFGSVMFCNYYHEIGRFYWNLAVCDAIISFIGLVLSVRLYVNPGMSTNEPTDDCGLIFVPNIVATLALISTGILYKLAGVYPWKSLDSLNKAERMALEKEFDL